MQLNNFLALNLNLFIKELVNQNQRGSIQESKKILNRLIDDFLLNISSIFIDLDYIQKNLFYEKVKKEISHFDELVLGLVVFESENEKTYFSLIQFYLDEKASLNRKLKVRYHSYCLKRVIEEFKKNTIQKKDLMNPINFGLLMNCI